VGKTTDSINPRQSGLGSSRFKVDLKTAYQVLSFKLRYRVGIGSGPL
jgi:hypothetical protein